MAVILNLPLSGVPKRVILDMAFQGCGLANYDFDITPEQDVAALRKLNAQMKEWPWSLVTYNQPDYSVGLPEELSNVPGGAENAIADELSIRIAPGLNLTVSPEQRRNAGISRGMFVAQFTTVPESNLPGGVPLGTGNRWYRYGWGWGANYSGRV